MKFPYTYKLGNRRYYVLSDEGDDFAPTAASHQVFFNSDCSQTLLLGSMKRKEGRWWIKTDGRNERPVMGNFYRSLNSLIELGNRAGSDYALELWSNVKSSLPKRRIYRA